MAQDLEGKALVISMFGNTYNTVFRTERYSNSRFAIELDYKGDRFATLTTNLPDVPLEEDQVIIKTWSENEEIAKAALASGLFRDTGMRVSTGFVQAQIWEVL